MTRKIFNIDIPVSPLPIFIIGAGGIVNDAHLPAYRIAGFEVAGIYDIDEKKARETAKTFEIPLVFSTLDEMIANIPDQMVFDVAVPGSELPAILEALPERSNVLFQKPMGENYAIAMRIIEITRQKKMNAAVNFQLRYAPFIAEARKLIESGSMGKLVDVEVNVNVFTPWHQWNFLYGAERVEILYHSIHYIDLVRSLLGEPQRIYARTFAHPAMKELASVRSTIIMDYGNEIRAAIHTNHTHVFGKQNQLSYINLEGTSGAIRIEMGLLKNYPEGEKDSFSYILMEDGDYKDWKKIELQGSWFPHAFIGTMAQVMLAATGIIPRPDNSVEDCIYTMACVEAAYESSLSGGVSLLK